MEDFTVRASTSPYGAFVKTGKSALPVDAYGPVPEQALNEGGMDEGQPHTSSAECP